jgi:hypothetical protein
MTCQVRISQLIWQDVDAHLTGRRLRHLQMYLSPEMHIIIR